MTRQKTLSRRGFCAGAASCVAGLGAMVGLAACGNAGAGTTSAASQGSANTAADAADRRVAGYESVALKVFHRESLLDAPLYVAQERGFFKQYNLVVEFVNYPADLQEAFKKSGRYMFTGGADVLYQINEGASAKLLSGVYRGCSSLMGRTDSTVKGLDVVGKSIGVVGEAGAPEIACKAALARDGRDFGQSNWVRFDNRDKLLTALRDGTVDLAALDEDASRLAIMFLDAKTIYEERTDSYLGDGTCTFLAANNAVFADDELCGRLCTAVQQACTWINENRTEAATILMASDYLADLRPLLAKWDMLPENKKAYIEARQRVLCDQTLGSLTFGDTGLHGFTASIQKQWECLRQAGVLSTVRSTEELVKSVNFYAL